MTLEAAVASEAAGYEADISTILLWFEVLLVLVAPGITVAAGGVAVGWARQNHQSGWLTAFVVLLVLSIVGPLAGLALFLYGAVLLLNTQSHDLGTAPVPSDVAQATQVLSDIAGSLQLMPLLLGMAGVVYSLRSASRFPSPR
jgi:hypothetical protein